MKHVFLLLTMLVAASSVAFSQATGTTRVRSSGDEEAVRMFFAEAAAATGRNDAAALERMWAPDYTFVTALGVLVTREQRLASLRSGDVKYDSVTPVEVSVRTYGDTAVAVARVTVKGHAAGQDLAGDYRSTLVAVRKNGSWQIVAQQSTRIVQP